MMTKRDTLIAPIIDNCHMTLWTYCQLMPLFSLILTPPLIMEKQELFETKT